MPKKIIEYNADSILHYPGGADLSGPTLEKARNEVAMYWDPDYDLVQIRRISDTVTVAGYIGFNRRKGVYFWLTPDRSCRKFDPSTGKLGEKVKIPAGTLKEIENYKKTVSDAKKKFREMRKKKRTWGMF